MRSTALLPAVLALCACTQTVPVAEPPSNAAPPAEPAPPPSAPTAAARSAPSPGPFATELAAIARDYRAWGRVDDEMRWAPWLCRMPWPAEAHVSASTDSATHGDKLYSLFAKDRAAYVKNASAPGQVIVKESWKPERVADPGSVPTRWNAHGFDAPIEGDHFHPFARKPDGSVYRAAERAGLFVMFKVAPDTPGTDQGWVYATLTPNDEITAVGRVESCMECHKDAGHDRLFGVGKRVPY